MQKHAHFLTVSTILTLLLTACSQSQIIVTITPTAAETALPTLAILEKTATPPPPTEPVIFAPPTASPEELAAQMAETTTPGQPVIIDQIYMTNPNEGWGWGAPTASGETPLMHTTDGGQTWQKISPPKEYIYYGGSFLDGHNAWLLYYSGLTGTGGMLRTNDAGLNWMTLPQKDDMNNAWIDFSSPVDGIAETASLGAGNSYITHYQTSDGGTTWSTIPLLPPTPEADLPTGVVHLCNICGDRMYYDPSRTIILNGDMAGDPTGNLRMSVSFNLGQTWANLQIPLPSQYADGYASPFTPVFFGLEGIIPVGINKYNPDGSPAFSVLAIYKTSDGGQTWQQAPAILEDVSPQIDIVHVISGQKIFVRCGKNLCTSNDGAQSWSTLPEQLNFDLNSDSKDYVTQYSFIDSSNGWAVSGQSGATTLWHSTDGGLSWKKLSPTIH